MSDKEYSPEQRLARLLAATKTEVYGAIAQAVAPGASASDFAIQVPDLTIGTLYYTNPRTPEHYMTIDLGNEGNYQGVAIWPPADRLPPGLVAAVTESDINDSICKRTPYGSYPGAVIGDDGKMYYMTRTYLFPLTGQPQLYLDVVESGETVESAMQGIRQVKFIPDPQDSDIYPFTIPDALQVKSLFTQLKQGTLQRRYL